ncbi:MAG: hypothetical protein HGA44_12470, partial [Cellulomonadaceae bacterium]|nr:hypothetical protein [Cellulomonadaceae bacterium]
MTSTKTRRAASVALVGAALVGLQTASAIGADLDGRDLFVGADSVDTCSSSAITVDYDVDYDSDLQGYGVSAAELSGFDAQCQGYDLIVSLNGPGGVPLAEMTSAVEATRVRVAVPAGTPVAAEQLTGVSVVR